MIDNGGDRRTPFSKPASQKNRAFFGSDTKSFAKKGASNAVNLSSLNVIDNQRSNFIPVFDDKSRIDKKKQLDSRS